MSQNDIILRDGMDQMNFQQVTAMLASSKWSPGIKIEEVVKGATYSALVVGAFLKDEQIGYARVISDRTRFAYIADVFVREDSRHRGVASRMMRHMMEHPSLKDVYQWLLKSAANDLYSKLGFLPLSNPDEWMIIRKERNK